MKVMPFSSLLKIVFNFFKREGPVCSNFNRSSIKTILSALTLLVVLNGGAQIITN
ncbi:hypothetical protein HDC91_000182 [Mucilaginibacter sp. AK015]|nr:hypothetical protein [Mucilaginibacter sp. AK015]